MRKSEKISILSALAGAAGYGVSEVLKQQGVKVQPIFLTTGASLATGLIANRVIVDDVPLNKEEYYDRIARKNEG